MPVSRESIDTHAKRAYGRLAKHFKELGIDVPEMDGPAAEAGLFSLQAIQHLDAAVTAHNEQKSARAENLAGFTLNGESVTTSAASPTGKK